MSSDYLPFQYSPLERPRQIRLLKVRKSSGGSSSDGKSANASEDIQDSLWCEFKVVSLDELPHSYHAVSYVWGDLTKTGKVFCGASRYIILTTSATCLLETIVATGSPNYFWIDALCIDQSNKAEKGRQVRLMRDIFARAEKVAAWLGRTSPGTGEAVEFIIKLHNHISKLYRSGQPVTRYNLTQSPCESTATGWAALSIFLENPFFQRMWIIQEMVVSTNVYMLYGDDMIKWDILAEVLAIIAGNGLIKLLTINQEDKLSCPPEGIDGVVRSYAIRHLCRSGEPPTLVWCMFNCWRCQAGDPRDKIFALLGMASDASDPEFDPRYEDHHSPQRIYMDTTRHLLTRDKPSVDILHGAGIGLLRNLSGLPSWVPDWSSPFFNTVFGAVAKTAQFRASGDLDTAYIHCNKISRSMTLQGRIIDTISVLADPMPEPIWRTEMNQLKQKAQVELTWLEDLCKLLKPNRLYPTGEAFFPTVISRTLIANTIPPGIPAPKEYYTNHFHELLACYRRLIAADAISWELGIPGSTVESVYAAAQYADARSMALGIRRVFLSGHSFLGLGPPGTQQEDKVCILLGLATPFLVRKREEGGYCLVGECYVDGFMNGEGLSKGNVQNIILY